MAQRKALDRRPRQIAMPDRVLQTEAVRMARRSVERWCDWIDALVHYQTHASYHLQPAKYDPDPQKRELAALGINQRNYANMDDFSKTWWQ